jgi:pimeloyl-ACP methyl ester carboxylesterase
MKKILLITITLIGLSSFLTLPAVAAPKWSIPDGIKTIDVNGYDMAYQETGSGIPLVLVHGSLTDYRTWNAQVPDFSKAYRTISVSLRHYYPEKWNGIGDDFSITQHASDVAALIKNLNLGKVHLLGHSRGGAVVLHVAKLYPEVIRTLILEDAAGMESILPDSSESKTLAAKGAEIRKALRANIAGGDMDKAAREFTDGWNGPGSWEKLPAATKQMVLDNLGTGIAIDERPKISCADIQNFTFPVLTLTGERSPKRYGETYGAMRQCKPDIPAPLIVPNATHTMHGANLGNPGFFNKVVLQFLNQH